MEKFCPRSPVPWLIRFAWAVVVGCGYWHTGTVAAATEPWSVRYEETYKLQQRESIQFRVPYSRIPVRSWRLVVESNGNILSDLHVLRLADESLLYFETYESHHAVNIPWGSGEEIAVVLTAGRHGGLYTITFLGPPAETAPVSYSYRVNRALEAYAVGNRLGAEELCRDALREDPSDGVARVMLAGFLRDRHFYDQATVLLEEAMAGDLPAEMQELAVQLSKELKQLRVPLAPEVEAALATAARQLEEGQAAAAVATCDHLLAEREQLTAEARSRALQCRGQGLHSLGRHFEAVDAYTRALTVTRSRDAQAVIYFHMAQLFVDMDNPNQAEGAFNIAIQYGLPPGLELQAAETLRQLPRQKE